MTLILKNDVARLVTKNSINRRAVRVLQSRVKSFTTEIEIDEHQRLIFDLVQKTISLLSQLIVQITRIVDYFARHVNRSRRAETSQC
jgi:hypothetical protein